MLNLRRFVRYIQPNIIKPLPHQLPPLIPRVCAPFTQQKTPDNQQQINQVKQEAKEFYNKYLEDIIELQSYEDWQQIVGSCTETMLIDFYANWCVPCKKLTPRLEQKVKASGGKLKLLKINIDNFGKIAQVFQIKAVPTVFMIHQGKAIDAFSGEITDEQLDKFLETAARASKGDKERQQVSRALEQAKGLMNSGDYAGAQKILTGIKYNKVAEEYKLVGDIFLACTYSQQEKMPQLKSLVDIMKTNAIFYVEKPEFKDLFEHLCQICDLLEKQKESNTDLALWKKKIESDPSNLALRFQAAAFYRQNQMIEECLEQLLTIVKADKNWEEKKANKEILAIFKELGNSSPLTQTYRRLFQQALH